MTHQNIFSGELKVALWQVITLIHDIQAAGQGLHMALSLLGSWKFKLNFNERYLIGQN